MEERQLQKQIPSCRMHFEKDGQGKQRLVTDRLAENLAGERLDIVLTGVDGQSRIFRIFQQKAGRYGDYSEYMARHGCACCSLTTLLSAYSPGHDRLSPEETAACVERQVFSEREWRANYRKHIARQMPVSLYGISLVLCQYKIPHRYIGDYQDAAALIQMREHLLTGRPVVVETSRRKRKDGRTVRWNDKKFAGSYHTMILLGVDPEGYVLFADSASRAWAGRMQRIKRAGLGELLAYMFPQINTEDKRPYFSRRRNTGGYILIDA